VNAAPVSTRGTVPGLRSPHRLVEALPALYRQDEFDASTGTVRPNFAQRFTSAFDELLAPVFSSLDNFDAYLDPRLAPPDFLSWLAGWVGVELDENWPLERCRALVLDAVALYRRRGTARGLAETVAVFTGVEPEIVDNGGVAWSTEPEVPFPGSADPHVTVRVRVPEPEKVDRVRLEALVAAAKPAHLVAEIEVEAA
jgi:phage tail-like protein